MAASTTPFPLLPPLEELHNHQGALQPLNDETRNRLSEIDPRLAPVDAWRTAIDFLTATTLGIDDYRPAMKALEVMLQWSWLVEGVDVMSWDYATAQRFIALTSPIDERARTASIVVLPASKGASVTARRFHLLSLPKIHSRKCPDTLHLH